MQEAKHRHELTDDDSGHWLVTTVSGSVYAFNLDTNTVARVGGQERVPAAPSDSLQSLRGIITLRVGERGRWWIRILTGGYADTDEIWQWSSEVTLIKPAPTDTAPPGGNATSGPQSGSGEGNPTE